MARQIKAVFFDAGGTILTIVKDRFERIREALLARGIPVSIEEIQQADLEVREFLLRDVWIAKAEQEERFWGDYYRKIVEALKVTDDVERLAQELLRETFWVDWTLPYPDAIPVLKALKGRYKLGVISNAYPSMLNALERTGLAPFMDSITISAYVGVGKPHPLIYQAALDSLQVQADESVFVDDLEENVSAAEAMGFTSFLIDRNAGEKAPGVIPSLYALLEFLGALPREKGE